MTLNTKEQVRLMRKNAFVKNVQRATTSSNSNSNSKSPIRHCRNRITADVAYEMVMHLQQEQQHIPHTTPSHQASDGDDDQLMPHILSIWNSTSSTTSMHSKSSRSEEQPKNEIMKNQGFCKDYKLGDYVRSLNDMAIKPSKECARQSVATLKPHDFAFVKRSNGSYSYAIVALRTQDSVTFAMCADCSTKNVRRKHWAEFVRLVKPPLVEEEEQLVEVKAAEVEDGTLPPLSSKIDCYKSIRRNFHIQSSKKEVTSSKEFVLPSHHEMNADGYMNELIQEHNTMDYWVVPTSISFVSDILVHKS